MSSGRTILSRPRTRVYDANYNIGESYYRPALDRLNRKYSGRPLSPPRQSSLPTDLLERHGRIFGDEDLESSRRRAEKRITESNLFDSRGSRLTAERAFDLVENDIDQETASSLKRIRANKKVSMIDDVDLESTVSNLNTRRLLDRSEKVLKSVGLDENSRRVLDEDVSVRRRNLKVTYENDVGAEDLTRWRPLKRQEKEEQVVEVSQAARRAKQSRDRLSDLEEEMAAIAQKQQARERRAARLKALVAESTEETEAAQSAIKALSIRSSRREQRTEDE